MKIPQKLMCACIDDFKEIGTITAPLLMRRHRIDCEMGEEIIKLISLRYPNLWKNRKVKF